MSLFGTIMLFIAMGWTLFLIAVVNIIGIFTFLRGSAVLFFVIGYVIIILVTVVLKKIVQSM